MLTRPHMKTSLFASLAAFALVVGCGSSSDTSSDPAFGPDPDFAAYGARFTHPDGTMNAGVFSSYRDGASVSSPIAGTATGTKTQAIHVLGQTLSFDTCPAFESQAAKGTCACPDGGTFGYDFSEVQAHASSVVARVRFDACRLQDLSMSGREFIQLNVANSVVSGILVANIDYDVAGASHTLDLAGHIQGDSFELAIQVDDGWVAIAYDGGTYTVRDRNGTWSCLEGEAGATTCTSATGETKTFPASS